MAKTSVLTPSSLSLDDDTIAETVKLLMSNGVLSIDKPVGFSDLRVPSSNDLSVKLASGQLGKILDNNENNLVVIDNDTGIITVAKQSAFLVNKNGSDQTINASSVTKVSFTNAVFDRQGEFDVTTNYRFTATKSGLYLFTAQITWQSLGNTADYNMIIFKNGASYLYLDRRYLQSGHNLSLFANVIVELDQNDYIELYVWHNSASSETIDGNTYWTFFAGAKIS